MSCGNIICTKPGNARRFQNERRDLWVRTAELPPRPGYDPLGFGAGCYKFKQPNFFCRIHYRMEDESLALQHRLIGKGDYNPVFDIDRYAVECGAFYREGGVCPVFEKLRAVLDEQILRGADKLDVRDDAGRTFVCDGDGRVGPIAPFVRDDYHKFLPLEQDLASICQACEYRRDESGNSADEYAELLEYNGKTVNNRLKYGKNIHGGIIPFFRRLLGRRK